MIWVNYNGQTVNYHSQTGLIVRLNCQSDWTFVIKLNYDQSVSYHDQTELSSSDIKYNGQSGLSWSDCELSWQTGNYHGQTEL